MPNIDVVIEALGQFAGQGAIDLDLETIAPLTFGAGSGGGQMTESQELVKADGAATDAIMAYLTEVRQGMQGYRVGVAEIATVYAQAEDTVVATMDKVLRQEPGLPAVDPSFAHAEAAVFEGTR